MLGPVDSGMAAHGRELVETLGPLGCLSVQLRPGPRCGSGRFCQNLKPVSPQAPEPDAASSDPNSDAPYTDADPDRLRE